MSEKSLANRIVVGVDRSPSSRSALAFAARWAAAEDKPMTLLTAAPPVMIDPGVTAASIDGFFQAVQRSAQDELATVREELLTQYPNLEVDVLVAPTLAANALIEASSEAEVLFIGTHSRSGLMGRLVGSAADQVVTHAHGPVVVVPEDVHEPPAGPVVVGVDNSDASAEALRMGLRVARNTETSVVAMHAWNLDFAMVPPSVVLEPEVVEQLVKAEEQMLTELVDSVAKDYPTVAVETVMSREVAPHALVEASKNASLVVVGNRGRGGFVGLLLGSTSRKVLHGAHCPVLVVHARS